MRSRFLFMTSLLIVVIAGGCSNFGEGPTQSEKGTWTISGEIHFVGSIEPLSGVKVECGLVSTTSGDNGRYVLNGIPDGAQTITATREDCDAYSRQLDVRSNLTHYIYMIFDGTDLSGYVTNPIEGGIKGAKVQYQNQSVMTDANGWYQFGSVRHGTDSLRVTHPRFYSSSAAVTLAGSSARFDMVLHRDSTFHLIATIAKYVDEAAPEAIWVAPIDHMYLRSNGYDNDGNYVSGVRRNLLVTFYFPSFVNHPSVSISTGALLISTDNAYPSTPFQTFAAASYWSATASYRTAPAPGELLYSGSIGDDTVPKY